MQKVFNLSSLSKFATFFVFIAFSIPVFAQDFDPALSSSLVHEDAVQGDELKLQKVSYKKSSSFQKKIKRQLRVSKPNLKRLSNHASHSNHESAEFFLEDANEAGPVLNVNVLLNNPQAPSLWPVNGVISSNYGVRRGRRVKVIRRKGKKKRYRVTYTRHHAGIDIAAPSGTPIVAPADAIVSFVGVKGGYGKTVILSHGKGLTSLYAHNSQMLVHLGQKVKKGQLISKVGTTGRSSGPHLHFEIRRSGKAVNPMTYLKGAPKPSRYAKN